MTGSRKLAGVLASAAIMIFTATFAARAQDSIVPGAADNGPPSTVENFGTWSTRCQPNPQTGKDVCHAFVDVRITNEEQKVRVLYLAIGYVPEEGKEGMFALALTPLGTLLPPGIGFQVDGQEKFGGPFAFCFSGGCQSDLLLTDEKIAQLRAGAELKVAYVDIRRGQIEIPVGLDGISKALDSLPKPGA